MAIKYHPGLGTIIRADFEQGFKKPEMVKQRLGVVISPPIRHRVGLCTIVPLSKTPPTSMKPYHYELDIPFKLPRRWGNTLRWVKGDMVCSVGFHRLNLLWDKVDEDGKRQYILTPLSRIHMRNIHNCVLASLGIPPIDK